MTSPAWEWHGPRLLPLCAAGRSGGGKAEHGDDDTVVVSWALCSLGDARAGLAEMLRVLRADGELLFVEHGLTPERGVSRWQHRLDPLWSRLSCHLDNPVDRLLRDAGFEVVALAAGYLGRGPKPMTYMHEGRARPDGRKHRPSPEPRGATPRRAADDVGRGERESHRGDDRREQDSALPALLRGAARGGVGDRLRGSRSRADLAIVLHRWR